MLAIMLKQGLISSFDVGVSLNLPFIRGILLQAGTKLDHTAF
jgi:hypothetical protein